MEDEIEVSKYFIGEYDSSFGVEDFDFITEAKENSGKEGFKVEVWEKEGPIPHCHVTTNTGKRVCVCIHSNNYFDHNKKWGAKFTSNERKIFDKWVRAKYLSKDEMELRNQQRNRENAELKKLRREDIKAYKIKVKELHDKWNHEDNDPAENVEDSNWYHLKTEWETRNPDCTFPESKKVKSIPKYKDMESFRSRA